MSVLISVSDIILTTNNPINNNIAIILNKRLFNNGTMVIESKYPKLSLLQQFGLFFSFFSDSSSFSSSFSLPCLTQQQQHHPLPLMEQISKIEVHNSQKMLFWYVNVSIIIKNEV